LDSDLVVGIQIRRGEVTSVDGFLVVSSHIVGILVWQNDVGRRIVSRAGKHVVKLSDWHNKEINGNGGAFVDVRHRLIVELDRVSLQWHSRAG